MASFSASLILGRPKNPLSFNVMKSTPFPTTAAFFSVVGVGGLAATVVFGGVAGTVGRGLWTGILERLPRK